MEVELIAELPDIEVEVLPELPLSGATDWVRDHWHVQINADDSLWRCRSTLAHEYKHILDDPFREELYPRWPRGAAMPPDLAERICDYFAGCVLVPRQWLYKAWDDGLRDPAKLASHFDVSESLIEVRMDQTKVSTRPIKYRWQRASRKAYQRSARLVRNATLHLGTKQTRTTTTRPAATNKLTKGEKNDFRNLCSSSATA
ncbi:ImmA/IrrE family metallo-endopeptidase [Micromonospora sp. Llam7]|uniref:ImmA/IrrE family metallo-endopeptidase n=1 Tax=Micromonospora tarapacensis TaxID=2835305 RepID=UPI001C82F804|nr:ImmA/IrrE family metallo-endopeptidase [Micromonospora tarapacensis]